MRIGVRPWSDETLAGYRQSLKQARNCILIAIGPTTDRINRALDRRVVFAYRSVLPICIAPLVVQPIFLEQRYVLQALQPHRSPAIADQLRIGWQTHQAKKEKGPLKCGGGKQRATHIVRVVCVPIVGRANRYECLERRGTSCRNLQSVEPTPGNSHHPDRATAPGLRCKPRDHLHAVVLFLLGVLVEQQARRFAATAKVHANSSVTVASEIGMS